MYAQLFAKGGALVATVAVPPGTEIVAYLGVWYRLANGVFVESAVFTA